MRLILLPTPGMPTRDAVIVEDYLFERSTAPDPVAEQRSAVGPSWVTYYPSSAAFGSWR